MSGLRRLVRDTRLGSRGACWSVAKWGVGGPRSPSSRSRPSCWGWLGLRKAMHQSWQFPWRTTGLLGSFVGGRDDLLVRQKARRPARTLSAGLTCPGFGHVEGRSESRVDTGLVPGSAVEKTAAGPPRRNGTASPWTATRRAARSSDDTVDHVVAELRSERPLLVKEVDRHGDRQSVKIDADTSWALSEGSTSGAAWETAPPAPGRLRVQQPYFTA